MIKSIAEVVARAALIVAISSLFGIGLGYGISQATVFSSLIDGKAVVITVVDLGGEDE